MHGNQVLIQLQAEFRHLDALFVRTVFHDNRGDVKRSRTELRAGKFSIGAPETGRTVLTNKEHADEKRIHQQEIDQLYALRKSASTLSEKRSLEKSIDKKVIRWNEIHQCRPNYFDLHGMTERGAVGFVQKWLRRARKGRLEHTILELETGRGRHSKGGKPVIRTRLGEIFEKNKEVCRVETMHRNPGVLIVYFE